MSWEEKNNILLSHDFIYKRIKELLVHLGGQSIDEIVAISYDMTDLHIKIFIKKLTSYKESNFIEREEIWIPYDNFFGVSEVEQANIDRLEHQRQKFERLQKKWEETRILKEQKDNDDEKALFLKLKQKYEPSDST